MEKKVINEIQELNKFNGLFSIYENVLGIADIEASLFDEQVRDCMYHFRFRSNTIGMILTLEGTCTVQLEDAYYTLLANRFLLIPACEQIQLSSTSHDFRATILIVEKSFMDECITNKRILSFFNYILVKRLFYTELKSEDTQLLTANFNSLKEKMKIVTHSHYKEVISVSFMSLMLDLSHILNNKKEDKVSHLSTRKEEIFNKFLNLLLVHYKEQHEVAFYADKLFITPQYLTLIIKDLTGKTTNKWIDDTLIMEARKLLKTTHTTVQQIADLLNFSDQSTFGKFFKKYHGISPAEYRKMHYNSLSIA